MAIRTETITLDVSPSCCSFAKRQCVAARQGDAGMVLDVDVTENAQPLSLDGLTATLLYNNPDLVQVSGTVDGSTASFTIPSAGFSGRGVHQAYVQLARGGTVIASTEAFDFNIAKGADLSAQQSQGYVPQLDEALATAQQASQTAETAATQATQAVDDANTALQTANTAVQNANTAAAAANAAAENANNAAQTVRTNILTGTVGPAVVASADDAHPGALMREVQVLGQTRQNLWSNPNSTLSGVSATSNEDGSISLSGTASEYVAIYTNSIYVLKPSTQYTASVDSAIATEFSSSGAAFYIEFYDNSGSYVDAVQFGYGSLLEMTFTTNSNSAYCKCEVLVKQGTAVSGTYRVMLNEGGTAEPWCPPGLTSVSELSVVCAGKNLCQKFSSSIVDGVIFDVNDDGSITVTGTPTADYPAISVPFPNVPIGSVLTLSSEGAYGSGVTAMGAVYAQVVIKNINSTRFIYAAYNDAQKTFSVPDSIDFDASYIAITTGTDKTEQRNRTIKVQLELGTSATAYEPPSVTVTPQDLEGHELRSLPDGTCDMLTWDETGAVSVDVQLAHEYLDDISSYEVNRYVSRTDAFCWRIIGALSAPADIVNANGNTRFVSNYPNPDNVVFNENGGYGISLAYTTPQIIYFCVDGVESADAVKEYVASHPIEIIYPVAESIADLTPVPMPEQPSTTLNVWADADEGLSPEVEVVYERDLTLAYNDLASKVAALAVAQATN